MKERRSGEQREINNRAKCEDHGYSFQQTPLKTVQVRGEGGRGSGTGHGHIDQGTAQVRHVECVLNCMRVCVCVCVCTSEHEISARLTQLLCAAFEMHRVHIEMNNQHCSDTHSNVQEMHSERLMILPC